LKDSPATIAEVSAGDRVAFETARAGGSPLVMRGLVRDWPLCIAAGRSAAALADYLSGFYNGTPVHVMTGPAEIEGRLFYSEDFRRLNFHTREAGFREALDAILAMSTKPKAATIYMGSAAESRHWPGLARANPLPLLGSDVNPNLWIGGPAVVGPHNDYPENVACVVAGRRRFRLFPPEQFANLYIGPLELSPAGRPVSFVSVTDPDFARYPRYAQALEASLEAELETGDAIYIPSMWWHSVESLAPFNMLVNYWGGAPESVTRQAEAALIYALLAIAPLTPSQRRAWRPVFDHLVFRTGEDPVAHIPKEIRGALGDLTPDLRDRLKGLIRRALME
jgi:hypothetical protein